MQINTPYKLTATCAFGLEALVAQELRDLGYDDLTTENGKVTFKGTAEDIAITNLWLRTADRVVIQLAHFKAYDFDTLFDHVHALPWEDWLPVNAFIHIIGRSKNSKLFSIRDCQSLTKKAVIKALQRKHKVKFFEEDGPTYKIEVALKDDWVTLTADTTGASLHKRGYRTDAGVAPLKETLAAALVILSKWDSSRILADPFCGSGTIGIEAALIALNRAPGIKREFSAQHWIGFGPVFEKMRAMARQQEKPAEFKILCSDSFAPVLKKARQNAINAGVEEQVYFQTLECLDFKSRKKYGVIISNLPYGERLKDDLDELYADMREVMSDLETWSYFFLTSERMLTKILQKQANKRRKLYNGKIECHFHQIYGPLPPRKPYFPVAETTDKTTVDKLEPALEE